MVKWEAPATITAGSAHTCWVAMERKAVALDLPGLEITRYISATSGAYVNQRSRPGLATTQ